MAEYESVQQAEAAAGNKARELSEAVIRLLQQRQNQARARGIENEKTAQSYEPSQADEKFFQDLYQGYRDRGVDRETARAAAADITLGLGASESGIIQQAELQVAHKARLAEEYRATAQIAISPDSSLTEKQQAIARKQDLERSLGIHGQPIESKVNTINQLDPKSRTRQPIVQVESAQASRRPEGKETLRQSYQDTLEKRGARRETAKAASQDLVAGKGAADSPPIALAEREIERHRIIQDMYQGVYEKNGVSPEVAAAAADQLARGNGANRSTEVRQAHDQALANIAQAQQTSISPELQPTLEKSDANRSPETSQASKPNAEDRSYQDSQRPTPEPIPKSEKMRESSTKQGKEDQSTPDIEAPLQDLTLWQQHSPSEKGAKHRPATDYTENHRLNDSHFAFNAGSAGATPAEIKASILQNSPEAAVSQAPSDYADRVIQRVELARASSEQAAQPETSTEPTPKQTLSTQPDQKQRLSSSQVWEKYGGNSSGVFESVAKTNPKVQRESDQLFANRAIEGKENPEIVQQAIIDNSPHAKTITRPDRYAKTKVERAQNAKGKISISSDSNQERQAEKGHTSDLTKGKQSDSKKANQSSKSNRSTQKKSRKLARSQGQGPEL